MHRRREMKPNANQDIDPVALRNLNRIYAEFIADAIEISKSLLDPKWYLLRANLSVPSLPPGVTVREFDLVGFVVDVVMSIIVIIIIIIIANHHHHIINYHQTKGTKVNNCSLILRRIRQWRRPPESPFGPWAAW